MAKTVTNYLTIGTIRIIAKSYKYLLLRYADGTAIAVNSKVVLLDRNQLQDPNALTNIVSWSDISFMQYITDKSVIIKSK